MNHQAKNPNLNNIRTDYKIPVLPKEVKAAIYFVDEKMKPLYVNREEVKSVKEPQPFKNHIEYVPRIGEFIMVRDFEMYEVISVIHSLPGARSHWQKIFVVLEKMK